MLSLSALISSALVGCGGDLAPPVLPGSTLTVSWGGSGTGTIGFNDRDLFCALRDVPVEAAYPPGSRVSLMALPGVGSRFAGWTGACAGQGHVCVVPVDEAREARARFEARTDLPVCDPDRSHRAVFSRSPVDPARVTEVIPLAEMSPPEHVLPNPHMFLRVGRDRAPQVDVVAPGDAIISTVRASWSEELSSFDYYIQFSACRDVEMLVALVHDLPADLLARLGPPSACLDGHECVWDNLRVAVRAGEVVGRTHPTYAAVALEAYDARQAPRAYANPARYRAEHQRLQCPLDYIAPGDGGSSALRTRLRGSDGCEQLSQDVRGSARGAWFMAGAWANHNSRLGLFRNRDSETVKVFSVGEGVPNLAPGLYRFTADAAPGTRNQGFSTVRPGPIYCYEHLSTARASMAGKVVLMQMSDATHLTVRVDMRDDCSTAQTVGSLSNDLTAIEFER